VKLDKAAEKIEQYQIAIGQHITAIKAARPDDWLQIVETECGLGRSRAFELMAIADGRKTAAQTRAANTERKRKERSRESETSRIRSDIGELELARDHFAGELRLAERKISELESKNEDLQAQLLFECKLREGIIELLHEARGLACHPNNRDALVRKLDQAAQVLADGPAASGLND
jgi:predicted RNase H-like nuclease (RuvC/YqgF family)